MSALIAQLAAGQPLTAQLIAQHAEDLNSAENVDLQSGDPIEITALQYAAFLGRKADVALLLDHKADAEGNFGTHGLTTAHLAAQENHIDVLEVLLEHHVDIDARSAVSSTPLRSVVWRGANLATIEWLLLHGANINARDTVARSTSLLEAAQRRNLPLVQLLIKHGANLNETDFPGMTGLGYAAEYGDIAIVKTLLAAKANPFVYFPRRSSPLACARRRGHADIVALLAPLYDGPERASARFGAIMDQHACPWNGLEALANCTLSQWPEVAEDSAVALAALADKVDPTDGAFLRNVRVRAQLQALMLGLHGRVGRDSSVYRAFAVHPLAERYLLQLIHTFVKPPILVA